MQGYTTSDDAGVYRLSDDLALVVTADFITPPVDDPFVFGQVAAANALSDIYAMGARPLTCLNLVAFPSDLLPPETLVEIIRGALDRIQLAGATLAGGHTIEDKEPKFGLAVTGVVHPDRFWSNGGARAGDVLVLTKPIGSGVILNGNRDGKTARTDLDACIAQMIRLSKEAVDAMQPFPVHGATDVTGFGLAGHALEMARASDVKISIDASAIPLYSGTRKLCEQGVTTGVNRTNAEMIAAQARIADELEPFLKQLMVDPQTSGGLLIALGPNDADGALDALRSAGYERAAIIGRVSAREDEILLDIA